VMGPARALEARLALSAGRRDEARALAVQVSRLDPAAALLSESQAFVDFTLLLCDLNMGDDLARLLDSLPPHWPWSRAGRAIAAGDFLAAAEVLRGSGHRLWEAMLRLRAAELLAEGARHTECQEQLSRSLDFFRPIGASRYIRQADGLRRSVPGAGATG
jgi:hypothetical protein